VPGARAIADAAARAGVRSQMFSLHHTPWAARAHAALEGIGRLRAIHVEILFAKGHPGTAPLKEPRRQEPFPARFSFVDSKRELRATGVYAVSLIRTLTAGAAVRSVYALTANYFFVEHHRNGAEDFGLMSLELENGVTATVTAGRIGWASHAGSGPMRVTLVGDRESATIDAHRPRVEVWCDEPPWTPPKPLPEDPMGFWQSTQEAPGTRPKEHWLPVVAGARRGDAAAFLDCIEQQRDPDVTAADGAALVETLMAAYVSAARGEPVHPRAIDWPPDESLETR
jgi:predicted dehydrogenase